MELTTIETVQETEINGIKVTVRNNTKTGIKVAHTEIPQTRIRVELNINSAGEINDMSEKENIELIDIAKLDGLKLEITNLLKSL